MPKGEHFIKKCSFKNWETGEIVRFNSLTECAEHIGVSVQQICDLKNGRRKAVKNLCRVRDSYNPFKVEVKNLKSNEVLKFKTLSDASKELKVSTHTIAKVSNGINVRSRHIASPDYSSPIPNLICRDTGLKLPIYSIAQLSKENNIPLKRLHYFVNVKRISMDNDFILEGARTFKYKIINKKTGQIFTARTLKDFAEEQHIKVGQIYTKNKKCPFEVIEG